jgi:hypothetical protein
MEAVLLSGMDKDFPGSNIERLKKLPTLLLDLHKLLLDAERESYEKVFGKVESSGQMLKLVIDDPWFSWLRPLSQVIVRIEEAIEAKTPIEEKDAGELLAVVKTLLTPTEEGEGFGKEYYDALQRDPDVIFAHRGISQQLGLPDVKRGAKE